MTGNSCFPDMTETENYLEERNELLDRNIEKAKKMREKKREIGHTEENYDQDYIETQNVKSKDFLGNIYDILKKDAKHINLQDNSNDEISDNEVKQWELNKINQGLATHCK